MCVYACTVFIYRLCPCLLVMVESEYFYSNLVCRLNQIFLKMDEVKSSGRMIASSESMLNIFAFMNGCLR